MKVRPRRRSACQLNYNQIRDRMVRTLHGVVRDRNLPQRIRQQFSRLLRGVRHDGHPLDLEQALASLR
jgi:hypothetical protein